MKVIPAVAMLSFLGVLFGSDFCVEFPQAKASEIDKAAIDAVK